MKGETLAFGVGFLTSDYVRLKPLRGNVNRYSARYVIMYVVLPRFFPRMFLDSLL